MSDNSNIKSLIESLQKINEESTQEVTLPISKLKVQLKPIQAKHTTKINSSLMINAGNQNNLFDEIIGDILKDVLVLPEGKTYNNFGLFDYIFLLLKIRESINPILKVDDGETTHEVNVTELLKTFLKKKPKSKKSFEVTGLGKLTLSIPTYHKVRVLQNQLKKRQKLPKGNEQPNEVEMKKLIIDAFAFTIMPYLDTMEFVTDNDKEVIDFFETTSSDQIKFIDNLPNETYKEIMNVITELNTPIDDIRKVEGTEVEFQFDATLFLDN